MITSFLFIITFAVGIAIGVFMSSRRFLTTAQKNRIFFVDTDIVPPERMNLIAQQLQIKTTVIAVSGRALKRGAKEIEKAIMEQ